LVLSFFLMAILMAAIGAFGVYNLNQLNASTEEILREHQPILTDMAAIESSVLFHSLKVDQYVTTGNRAHLRAVEELRNDVETHLANLEDRTYGTEDQQLVQEIREAYETYVSLSDGLQDFYQRNPNDTAGVEGRQMRIAALLENALLAKADALYEAKQGEAQELIRASGELYRNYVKTAVVSSLVLTGLAIALSLFISRSIIVPVGQLLEATQRIAGGDLMARAQVRTGDEIGLLANAFNSMAAQLWELVENLEQRVAERTRDLSASEKRFRDIAESTADWIWEVDAAGRYTYCSESVVDVLGYTPEEVLGKRPFEFMPPDEAARVGEVFAEIAANKQPIVDLENRNLTKDGREVVLLTNGVPILDSEGKLLGYRGVDKDITERKRAEEQLQRYAAELEQSNEEVKRFAYIISHDLRAPLTNLKGFSEELSYALEVIGSAMNTALPHLDEKQQQAVTTALQEDVPEALGFIDSSVTRMDHFINAVLKLSRLGRRELNLEPIDMDALIQATLEILAYQIEERQVKVTVGSLPEVVADRTSMEQIMGNLLNNAVLYLDPGRPGEIEITAERGRDETTFRVRDNGRGIAEEDMPKVFAPFRRAGRQDVPGEGMGLPYVQTLVRRHGGRIWCESEGIGQGSTFCFTLLDSKP